MSAMLQEVKNFCDPNIRENWSFRTHQQLIYDFKDGGLTLGLIFLRPDELSDEEKTNFEKIGVEIPSQSKLHSRGFLDCCLSRALNVNLQDEKLKMIDENAYVLTLDFTIKMLNINERYKCGVPVIIEGETGVGKTALVEMISKLWNQSLLIEWKKKRDLLLDHVQKIFSEIPIGTIPEYQSCLQAVEDMGSNEVSLESLVLLCSQDALYNKIKKNLCDLKTNPLMPLLVFKPTTELGRMEQLFESVQRENTPKSLANLLHALLLAEVAPMFHKICIHAAMTPSEVQNYLNPVFQQANTILKEHTSSTGTPLVTVFLDEINTSSCLGLFKEIIVDRSFGGEV
jgi:hypothetical protein